MPKANRNRSSYGRETFLLLAALLVTGLALAPEARLARAGADAQAPGIPLKLPPDRVYADSVAADSAVTFSHATHVEYESGRCTGCHPRLYRILGPSPRTTHREMDGGGSCGTCHDGKHAFDVRAKESCVSCHAGSRKQAATGPEGPGATPPAFSGPKPYIFKSGSASPGVVTFRHETHRSDAMRCGSCHPKLFPMKAVPQDPNADWHETARCGGCHDGKQSFGVEDDASCEKCHKEGKAGK